MDNVGCLCCRAIIKAFSAAANQKPFLNKDLCTRKSVKRTVWKRRFASIGNLPFKSPLRLQSMLWILWSALTPERIGLESHWKHPWMRKTVKNPTNLTKNPYFAFAVLIFWKFIKIKKFVSRIPFSLSNPVFALRRPPEYLKTGSCLTIGSGCLGGKLGGNDV